MVILWSGLATLYLNNELDKRALLSTSYIRTTTTPFVVQPEVVSGPRGEKANVIHLPGEISTLIEKGERINESHDLIDNEFVHPPFDVDGAFHGLKDSSQVANKDDEIPSSFSFDEETGLHKAEGNEDEENISPDAQPNGLEFGWEDEVEDNEPNENSLLDEQPNGSATGWEDAPVDRPEELRNFFAGDDGPHDQMLMEPNHMDDMTHKSNKNAEISTEADETTAIHDDGDDDEDEEEENGENGMNANDQVETDNFEEATETRKQTAFDEDQTDAYERDSGDENGFVAKDEIPPEVQPENTGIIVAGDLDVTSTVENQKTLDEGYNEHHDEGIFNIDTTTLFDVHVVQISDGEHDKAQDFVISDIDEALPLSTKENEPNEQQLRASEPAGHEENVLDDANVVAPKANADNEEFPQCDKLPLDGGRHFWRNRRRIVDRDLSEICGPKVLIIGAMKCGTNTIAEMLQKHPRMQLNTCSLVNTQGGCNQGLFQAARQGLIFEGHDFTHIKRNNPEGWLNTFSKRLPLTDGVNSMTFDKSPSYLDTPNFPEVVKTAKQYLPNAKIIATLCNPAERLYSELHHTLQRDRGSFNQFYYDNAVEPPTDFRSFVNLLKPENPICNEKQGFCEANRRQYLQKGDYLSNLRPWYEGYGHENVLVVDMDDDPTSIMKSLLQHVGPHLLPESEYPWEEATRMIKNSNHGYEGRSSSYQYFNEEMLWLEQYYGPHNDELAVSLGADWPQKWNCRLNNNC